jgi:hypothetical protein
MTCSIKLFIIFKYNFMKNLIPLLFTIAIALACNKKSNTTETVTAESAVQSTDTIADPAQASPPTEAALYACPMHPEVTGKKGEKCPKCQMELTVPVK